MNRTKKQRAPISVQLHLYAIVDTLAKDLVGGISAVTAHKHEATAMRFFSDMATAQGSAIPAHADDFEFVRLGYLTVHTDGTISIEPDPRIAITGRQWLDNYLAATKKGDSNP